ncbi:MAG: hypothetical protein HY332_17065 [Chloroflexi bacterium]|nr:hypothetical protein [Chloroflexota bacterium]
MAVTAPIAPRRSGEMQIVLWVLLAGMAALAALAAFASRASPVTSDDALLRDIQTATDRAEQHGQAMLAFGTRLQDYASSPAGRSLEVQALAAQADHWRTDGAGLIQLASDVRRALATNPPRPRSSRWVELDRLEGQVLMLEGRGRAVKEHGQAMVELTAALARSVGDASDPWVRDGLTEMARQSTQMAAVGERLIAAGQAIEDRTALLRRTVGNVR